MADDRKLRGSRDRNRINVHERYEVRYWTRKFGVTADELREAVKNVGVMASDVERYFAGRGRRAA